MTEMVPMDLSQQLASLTTKHAQLQVEYEEVLRKVQTLQEELKLLLEKALLWELSYGPLNFKTRSTDQNIAQVTTLILDLVDRWGTRAGAPLTLKVTHPT